MLLKAEGREGGSGKQQAEQEEGEGRRLRPAVAVWSHHAESGAITEGKRTKSVLWF